MHLLTKLHTHTLFFVGLLFVGLLALLPSLATAQESAPEALLIVEIEALEDERLLPGIRVDVTGLGLQGITNESGKALIRGIPPGSHLVAVQAPGFASESFVVDFAPGSAMKAEIKLASDPEPLAAALARLVADETQGQADAPSRHEPAARQHRGEGTFLTRADIEKRQARTLSDVLRSVPGVRILYGDHGTVAVSARSGLRHQECPMVLVVDGVPLARPDVDAVSVEAIEAVDVYAGSSGLPAHLRSTSLGASCGAIVVWTRFGPGDQS